MIAALSKVEFAASDAFKTVFESTGAPVLLVTNAHGKLKGSFRLTKGWARWSWVPAKAGEKPKAGDAARHSIVEIGEALASEMKAFRKWCRKYKAVPKAA